MTADLPPDLTINPDLTIIVVSYNTRELTLAALQTLYDTTRTARFDTVVFDNASADGSAEAIAAAFPQVQLIRSADNLGFARANNQVAAAARTEWLLLLNPDTECQPGAVDRLLSFGKAHPKGGIYGGRTLFRDGSLNIASCWGRITLWSTVCSTFGLTAAFPKSRLFNPEALCGWPRDTVRQVDIIVGCFLLIRRSLWDQLGGFDLRYFMYGEDADLCIRAAKLGYQPMITPDAVLMHIIGASSQTRPDKQLLLVKGRVTLIRDHWPAWQVPFGLALMGLRVGLRTCASGVLALTGKPRARERFALWSRVWHQRRDWLRGY